MRRFALSILLAFALLSLTACDIDDVVAAGDGQRYTQDFHYSYPLKAGGKLNLETFNGQVEISGWDQETVDISGTKYASTAEMRDALRIDVEHSPDAVYIRTVRPAGRSNMGARYAVKVPRKALLERIVSSNGSIKLLDIDGNARVKTSNGSLRVTNLGGFLDGQTSNASVEVAGVAGGAMLHTSNGRIRAEDVRGAFEASTSNSSMHVNLSKADPGKAVRLETSNGSVDLTLPAGLRNDVRVNTSNSGITVHMPGGMNARLRAHTSNGGINTDYQVKTQGVIGKHHLEGTIGDGGPLLDLATSNGGIRLVRM